MSEPTNAESGPAEATDAKATAGQANAVLQQLAAVADGIDEAQLSAPTPCTELTVAELRDHVVSWSTAFGAGLSDPGGQAPDPATVTIEGSGAEQLREAGAAIAKGAETGGGDRDLTLADGNAMPGSMALSMILWEYQVHGWDLARATGQDWSPAEAPVEASLTFAPMMLTPDFQGEGKAFADRVPVADDAPAIDRLVGLSGRDPQWSPRS